MPTVVRRFPEGGSSQPQSSEHTSEWLVTLDAAGTPGDAINVTGAPYVGARLSTLTGGYAQENGLYCTDVQPERVDGTLVDFILRARFAARPMKRPTPVTASPTLEPASWSFRMITRKVARRNDWYDNLYRSAAGRPLRATENDEPGLVLIHERNENDTLIADPQWLNSMNNAPWIGFPMHCVLLSDIEFHPVYNNSLISHYRVRREFQIRFEVQRVIAVNPGPSGTVQTLVLGGWETARLNEDFYDINNTRFTDAAGNNCVEPQLLTANGFLLAAGQAPNYLRYKDYQEVNFSTIFTVLN